jgi:hypothetical protein
VVLEIPFSPSIILAFGLGCGMQKKLCKNNPKQDYPKLISTFVPLFW